MIAPDGSTAAVTAVAPLTPGEALALGAALWALGWVLVALRRPLRYWGPALVAAAVTAGYGCRTEARYREPVALVRHANTPLRAAPYVSAGVKRTSGEGTAVRIEGAYGGWVLVRRGADRGWMQESEVARLNPRGPRPGG